MSARNSLIALTVIALLLAALADVFEDRHLAPSDPMLARPRALINRAAWRGGGGIRDGARSGVAGGAKACLAMTDCASAARRFRVRSLRGS